MAKFDIRKNVLAADRLLATLTNPRHRRIIANYRRHAILEVSGAWEGIFDPQMTVANPEYHIDHTLFGGKPAGLERILEVYKALKDTKLNVIAVENEKILVGDHGFAHEADFYQYVRGAEAIEQGVAGLDADSWYRVGAHVIGVWWYDEHARLLGEHGAQIGEAQFVKIPEDEIITPEEAHDKLMPLLNELPEYSPEMEAAA